MYLFVIYVSCLVEYLFASFPTKNGLLVFFLLNFESYLYILAISPFSDMQVVNVSFQSVPCFLFLILLTVSFKGQTF